MFNLIPLIMSIMITTPPKSVPKPVQAPIAVARQYRVRMETPPHAEESDTSVSDKRRREFDFAAYSIAKNGLDERFSARKELRQKIAGEIAQLIGDYEEYCALTSAYQGELYRTVRGENYTQGGETVPEDGSRDRDINLPMDGNGTDNGVSDTNNNGTTGNGMINNGTTNNGSTNNGSTNNGSTNNGSANNGSGSGRTGNGNNNGTGSNGRQSGSGFGNTRTGN